jgi:N-acyl amino acid synthase of PEP-CTERM/exosortase system
MPHSQSAANHSSAFSDSTLSDEYTQWFEVLYANTQELKEKAYRLRYQVYCCEKQFETPEEHPQQLETDVFDNRALHSLIIDRKSGAATGTVRLILPNEEAPETSFPIQQLCAHTVTVKFPLSRSAEISRFAISKKIRRMAEMRLAPVPGRNDANPKATAKRMKCSITMLLMREIVQTSMERGITEWFAVMEPALLRLLSCFGIYFTPIGPQVEYHGMRQPCHANADKLLEGIRREHSDLWEFLTKTAP